ncbi:MAG: hypothetical protein V2A55_03260 [Candidatus Jorgensenbacteria bacterium]
MIKPDDFAFYEKIQISPPEICPDCRSENRLAFWPFGKFHKRTCSLTGEKIISIFPPQTRFPVYKNTNWYSDKWEPSYSDYNQNRPFFDQLYELQNKSPRPHQFGTQNQNCDYSDDVWESKNCYLCRSLVDCENVSYSYRVLHCRDSYDLFYCYDIEQSYDCAYCFKLFNVKYALDVRDSFDSSFLYDCRNVRNCFMCWNLRNKEYHILNKPYSKEDYQKKLKEYNLGSWQSVKKLEKEFQTLLQNEAIHRTNHNFKITNSTGDYLLECKNCHSCYFYETSENCAYVFRGLGNKDSQDGNGIWKAELVYDVCQLTDGYKLLHSNYCTNCRESEYLDFCVDCESCFGCVGLQKKRYCILNKQYSEADYKKLVVEIREKMKKDGTYGLFLPYRLATCGYNLSLGGIIYPKTREEVENLNGVWEEEEKPNLDGLNIYPFLDDIKDVGEGITEKALVCEETGRAFNITKDELRFLKIHEIPLPRHYPDVRTRRRFGRLFRIAPSETKCYFCSRPVVHFYQPELGYKKIACTDCYQNKVV